MQSVEIRIKGQLDPNWSEWFEGFELAYHPEEGETILIGSTRDQAALYGLIGKLRDLGVILLSVKFEALS